jgi:hypothetical protein
MQQFQGVSIHVWIFVAVSVMTVVYAIRITISSRLARGVAKSFINLTRKAQKTTEPGIHNHLRTLVSGYATPPLFKLLLGTCAIVVPLAWAVVDGPTDMRIALTALCGLSIAWYHILVWGACYFHIELQRADSDSHGFCISFWKRWTWVEGAIFGLVACSAGPLTVVIWKVTGLSREAKAVWTVVLWWPLGFYVIVLAAVRYRATFLMVSSVWIAGADDIALLIT